MLIDWFTVGAQVINFLILVWLLKRFLYAPVLKAIDAREQRIANALAEAEAKKNAAQKEIDDSQRTSAAFDQQRAVLLRQATELAQAEGQRLLDVARNEATALAAKREESLRREVEGWYREISERAQLELFAIARQVLTDLAGASLEERMLALLLCRLRALTDDEKRRLESGLVAASQTSLLIRSAFELSADQRSTLAAAIKETLRVDSPIQFATVPELICGVELNANGQKLAWNIADYLGALEKGVDQLVKKQTADAKLPVHEH